MLTTKNYMVCGNANCKYGYGDSTPALHGECMMCGKQQVPASEVPFNDLNPIVQRVYDMLERNQACTT